VTIATVPAYRLREQCRADSFEQCLAAYLEEEPNRRNAEFWWLPALDTCVLKTFDETTDPIHRPETAEHPPGTLERYLKPDAVDWSYRIYPSARTTPFVELEYTLPLAAGPAAVRELRDLVRRDHPACTWAVEYRTQPGEDAFLSPTQGQDSVTISVHQAVDQPWEAFFRDAEALFLSHGGRPHWGKLHYLDAAATAASYPLLEEFRRARRALDPAGVFANRHLRALGLAD